MLLGAEICLSFCFSSFFFFFFQKNLLKFKIYAGLVPLVSTSGFWKVPLHALPEYSSYPAPDQIKIQWTQLYGQPVNTCLFQQKAQKNGGIRTLGYVPFVSVLVEVALYCNLATGCLLPVGVFNPVYVVFELFVSKYLSGVSVN